MAMRADQHELPTPCTTLRTGYVRVLVWCRSCRHGPVAVNLTADNAYPPCLSDTGLRIAGSLNLTADNA